VLRHLLEHPDIDRITYLHLECVGPERLYLVAAVDMAGDAEHSQRCVYGDWNGSWSSMSPSRRPCSRLLPPLRYRSARSASRDVQQVSRSIASSTSSTQ
jgi:hypothetical protein